MSYTTYTTCTYCGKDMQPDEPTRSCCGERHYNQCQVEDIPAAGLGVIIDVVCFADRSKPATKTYSNFSNDFQRDTVEDFLEELGTSGDYVLINLHSTNYCD